ncbi:MAG: MBL fold metallo-hydrolase [Sphingopyxis sp.]
MKRILWIALVAFIVIGLIGVGTILSTQRPINVAAYPESVIAPRPAAPAAPIRLGFSIVPTATAVAPEGAMFEGGSWLKRRTLAHSTVMICHPRAFILFDTGLGRQIDSQFSDFPALTRTFFGGFQRLTPVADVIARDHVCPGRPLIIIPSHLHWDHAGGIEDFPDAPVWVQSAELQQVHSGGVDQGFLQNEVDAASIQWRRLSFVDHPYEHFRQSRDIFGDGSLILVPMAGHTAGSVGLFITVGGKRYFFTGDTSWALQGFSPPAHKFFAARSIADLDPDQLAAEIVGVHRLMERDSDLTIIPAHDRAAYPAGGVYPQWIGTAGSGASPL